MMERRRLESRGCFQRKQAWIFHRRCAPAGPQASDREALCRHGAQRRFQTDPTQENGRGSRVQGQPMSLASRVWKSGTKLHRPLPQDATPAVRLLSGPEDMPLSRDGVVPFLHVSAELAHVLGGDLAFRGGAGRCRCVRVFSDSPCGSVDFRLLLLLVCFLT